MYEQLSALIRREITISDTDLQKVLSCFNTQDLRRGEILLKEGEVNQRIVFVCTGCIRIYFITENGDEATRYLAFEGQFATSLVSLISKEPSMEYVQAVERSTILWISRDDFKMLLLRVPDWERFYRTYLEKAYVTNTNRLMSFLVLNASERYALALQERPDILQRLPGRILASYLNISPETLSRVRARK